MRKKVAKCVLFMSLSQTLTHLFYTAPPERGYEESISLLLTPFSPLPEKKKEGKEDENVAHFLRSFISERETHLLLLFTPF
jgi:hypothetical protein